MKNLYLDPATKDLTIGTDGNYRFTENLSEYVSQKIENNLQTYQNEWFLNPTLGLPYFDRILIKNADLDDVNTLLQAEILKIAEVERILEFDVEFDSVNRIYTVTFSVKITGETEPLEGEVTL